MKKPSTKTVQKLALTALLAAFAAILGYVDALLPVFDFLPVPGLKLGLANFAVLTALYLLGPGYALAVSVLRILIVNLLLFPSATALAFSLAGGLLSFLGMALFCRLRLHPVSTGVFGSLLHNLAQTAVAVLLLQTPALFSYLAFLLPVGSVCGAILGGLTALVLPRAEKALGASLNTGRKEP